MTSVAMIGCGAIGQAVSQYLRGEQNVRIVAALVEPGTEAMARDVFGGGVEIATDVDGLPADIDLAADCAGHAALRQHGALLLARGTDLVSVSSGALADSTLSESLAAAARQGGSQLRLVSGAIGALDALSAASVGTLSTVTYRGRKPPSGWRGSPAEQHLDLDSLSEAAVHFSGSAREAALAYPKNANVAASVALAGIGFDRTTVELVADPTVTTNTHEIVAEGDFGRLEFKIEGRALPDNPRSSALTAMSVVREILRRESPVVIN